MKNFKLALTLVFFVGVLTFSACSPDRFGTDEANPSVSSDSATDTATATSTDNTVVTAEDCLNTSDDDGDTLIDCDDTDCANDTSCLTESCADVVDNDSDGLTDCDDSECAADVACLDSSETSCNDGVDNDLDEAIDCSDADCANDTACLSEVSTAGDLSADYVYSFDPTTDTSTTYRVLSTTGSDTNTDGSENTTCSLTAPCASLEHIERFTRSTQPVRWLLLRCRRQIGRQLHDKRDAPCVPRRFDTHSRFQYSRHRRRRDRHGK